MTKLSRREFLLTLLASAGAVSVDQLLTACGQNPETAAPLPTQPPATTAAPTQVMATGAATTAAPQTTQPATADSTEPPATATPAAPETPAGMPDLVVARNGDPEAMVRRAIAALGGMEKFVKRGAKVVIKPNICVAYHTYEYAATTNPWVVAALVKMALEAGAASVKVFDYPFGGVPKEAYVKSGIQEQVKAAGGEMTSMVGFKYKDITIPDAKKLKKTKIYDDVLQADTLINVPIAKTHSLARLTIGMKNLMGVVMDRNSMHSDLGEKLTDLYTRIPPTLNVVDAVRILMRGGPSGGNLDDVKQANTIIASTNIVTADSYAATLFDMQPDELDYIRAAVARGLGPSDLKQIRIEEINVGA